MAFYTSLLWDARVRVGASDDLGVKGVVRRMIRPVWPVDHRDDSHMGAALAFRFIAISPQCVNELLTINVAWQSHGARISSRTK